MTQYQYPLLFVGLLCLLFSQASCLLPPPNFGNATVVLTSPWGSSAAEGRSFTLSVSVASQSQSVPCYISYTTVDGTATAGVDYMPATGTFMFASAQDSPQKFDIFLIIDNSAEPDEALSVTFSASYGCSVQPSSMQFTIYDKPLPQLSIGNVTQLEGNSSASNYFQFPFQLDSGIFQPVIVTVRTVAGTATTNIDFEPKQMQVIIPPQTYNLGAFPVKVYGDLDYEPDETFSVEIVEVINGVAGSNATGTILNDDPYPVIFASTTVMELIAGWNNIPVTLYPPSSNSRNVNFFIQPGTATLGVDFSAINLTGTLTFGPMETSKTIPINIIQDSLDEYDETIFIRFESAGGVLPVNSTSTITILDDDPLPSCSILAVPSSFVREDAGVATFVISLTSYLPRM